MDGHGRSSRTSAPSFRTPPRPAPPRSAPLIVLVICLAADQRLLRDPRSPRLLGDATNVTPAPLGKPAGVTQEQAVAGLRASGQTQLADTLAEHDRDAGTGRRLRRSWPASKLPPGVYVVSSIFSRGQGRQSWPLSRSGRRTASAVMLYEKSPARPGSATSTRTPAGTLFSWVTNDIDNIGVTLQQSLTCLIRS